MDDRMVVVSVTLTISYHEEHDLFDARLKELGLTAYRATETDAIVAVKRLFRTFVQTHRESGQLQTQLDKLGVDWWWKDEYPMDRLPYEDTTLLSDSPEAGARPPVLMAA